MDQAVTHFGDPLVFYRKADYRPELAWTCLGESLAAFTELSMPPLMERVLSRRNILKA